MSLSISYRPTAERTYVEGAGESCFRALGEVFGRFPIQLDLGHRMILRAMAVACDNEPNPYMQLLEAVDEHDDIIVTVEH